MLRLGGSDQKQQWWIKTLTVSRVSGGKSSKATDEDNNKVTIIFVQSKGCAWTRSTCWVLSDIATSDCGSHAEWQQGLVDRDGGLVGIWNQFVDALAMCMQAKRAF